MRISGENLSIESKQPKETCSRIRGHQNMSTPSDFSRMNEGRRITEIVRQDRCAADVAEGRCVAKTQPSWRVSDSQGWATTPVCWHRGRRTTHVEAIPEHPGSSSWATMTICLILWFFSFFFFFLVFLFLSFFLFISLYVLCFPFCVFLFQFCSFIQANCLHCGKVIVVFFK